MTEIIEKALTGSTAGKIDYTYKEHLIERQSKAEKAMLKEFNEGDYTLENPLIKYNWKFQVQVSHLVPKNISVLTLY